MIHRDYEIAGPVLRLWVLLGLLAALVMFACPRGVEAQVSDRAFTRTAAQLSAMSPNERTQRRFYVCSDCGSTASCTVGSGSTENLCKWNGSSWDVVGTGTGAPASAQYLTLASDGTLSAERTFTLGFGVAGTDAGANSTYTLALDLSDPGASPSWTAGQCRFSATTGKFIACEGATADAFETFVAFTDPTADRTFTIPNADSAAGQAITCSGTDKVSAFSASTGAFTCSADVSGVVYRDFVFAAPSLLALEHAADSTPPLEKDAGTNVDVLVLQFDASTDECAGGQIIVPDDLDTSGTVRFRAIWYSAAETTNEVVWDIRHSGGQAEGVTWDTALTTETAAADTTQGTVDQETTTVWTETVTNTSWAANDAVSFELCRDANHADDDMAGDASLISFRIEVPVA